MRFDKFEIDDDDDDEDDVEEVEDDEKGVEDERLEGGWKSNEFMYRSASARVVNDLYLASEKRSTWRRASSQVV